MRTSLALCVPLAELPARAAACAVLFSLACTVACTHSDVADPCVDADTRNGVDCQTLYIPPLLTGPDYDLSLAESSVEWSEGVATQTYAYNGQPFWGPTLRMHKGDDVRMNVTNEARVSHPRCDGRGTAPADRQRVHVVAGIHRDERRGHVLVPPAHA